MKRRSKIIATITTMCLALSMLVVGVLAASTVTFDITGTVSYIVEDVYVEFEARVYSSSKRFTSADDLQTTALSLESSNFDDINAMANLDGDTFNKVQIKNTSSPSTWSENNTDYYDKYSSLTDGSHSPLGLTLNYSSNPTKILTYFIVVKVKNLSSATLYASIPLEGDNKLTMPGNSLVYRTIEYVTIENQNESKYIVFAFSIDDMSKEIETTTCNFPIEVTLDEPGSTAPAVVLESGASALNREITDLSTSQSSPSNTVLELESNDLAGYFAGVDFEIPASAMSLYATEEYIDIHFTIMLTNLPAEMGIGDSVSFYQMYTMEGPIDKDEFLTNMITPNVLASSKSMAETTGPADLITPEITIEVDENNLETYTLSIPKSSLVNGNKFAFGFYNNLTNMMLEASAMGVRMELANLWSNTSLKFTKKVIDTKSNSYKIYDNDSFIFSGVIKDGGIIINFKLKNIPDNEIAVNLSLSSSIVIPMYSLAAGKYTSTSSNPGANLITLEQPNSSNFNIQIFPHNYETEDFTLAIGGDSSLNNQTIQIIVTPSFGEIEFLEYELSNDGLSYIVSGYYTPASNITSWEIPSEYKGLPVTGIKDSAFNDSNLIETTIPESITSVDLINDCFENSKVVHVTNKSNLNLTLQDLGIEDNPGAEISKTGQFTNQVIYGEKYITFTAEGNNYLMGFVKPSSTLDNIPSNVTHIYNHAFEGSFTLKTIDLPDNIKHIGNRSFSGCWVLENINLNKIETIGDSAFSAIDYISIVLPSTVVSVGQHAFSNDMGVTAVIENPNLEINPTIFTCYSSVPRVIIYTKATESTAEKDDTYWLGDIGGDTSISCVYYYSETQKEGNYWHYVDGKATAWNQ